MVDLCTLHYRQGPEMHVTIKDTHILRTQKCARICAQENMRVGEGGAFNKTSKHSLVIDNFLFITWTENEAPLKSTAEIIFFFL
ncbi:hypothetical protein CK203_076220 [Vitis vinifera]|uniref:Uncharacterized protein n=1 Tax=Vitis vinifera TaxID=29760 RepID=A0A438EEJ7_VITVI|nr:hypothetical protein CK203_076220 [Vitis vinifera]